MEYKGKTSSLRCMKYSEDSIHCVTSVRLSTRIRGPSFWARMPLLPSRHVLSAGKALPTPTYAQGPRAKKANAGWTPSSETPTFSVKVCYQWFGGMKKNLMFHFDGLENSTLLRLLAYRFIAISTKIFSRRPADL